MRVCVCVCIDVDIYTYPFWVYKCLFLMGKKRDGI